jgi:Tfp pilus assembly protein PilF
MGLVKMRQEEFIEARKFLQKALDFHPQKRNRIGSKHLMVPIIGH